MEPPKNKKELETILGMINYMSKFLPNLAAVTYIPIWKLFEGKGGIYLGFHHGEGFTES